MGHARTSSHFYLCGDFRRHRALLLIPLDSLTPAGTAGDVLDVARPPPGRHNRQVIAAGTYSRILNKHVGTAQKKKTSSMVGEQQKCGPERPLSVRNSNGCLYFLLRIYTRNKY